MGEELPAKGLGHPLHTGVSVRRLQNLVETLRVTATEMFLAQPKYFQFQLV